MEKQTDWIALWRALVEARNWRFEPENEKEKDFWHGRARDFSNRIEQRWQQPDNTRDFLMQTLSQHPNATLLDIGAGTGNWAVYLSSAAKRITALEPSAGMRAVLHENLERHAVNNVDVIDGKWPETPVEMHDLSLCSHAMYGIADFRELIGAMNRAVRGTCFLLIRAPLLSDPLAQIALRIWGHPNDSPNFRVAYNALMQMGIYADVLFEESSHAHPRRYDSFENAYLEIKNRFGVAENSVHDAFIRELLQENMSETDGQWVLKMPVRVALISWKTADVL